jgi:hypothetical protein
MDATPEVSHGCSRALTLGFYATTALQNVVPSDRRVLEAFGIPGREIREALANGN